MRHPWLLIPVLALLGCGAQSSLDEGGSGGSGGGGTTTTTASATPAYLQGSCAPTDGPAVALVIGAGSACPPTVLSSGISFTVSGPDLASLAAGVTLTVGADPNADTTAYRVATSGGATVVSNATGGTLTFATFATGQGGSGSYVLTFQDGSSAQGSFQASWCPGGGQCG